MRSVEVIQTPEKRAINLTYFVDLSVFGKDFMVEQDGGLSHCNFQGVIITPLVGLI